MKVLAIAPQPFFTPRGTPFSVYYRTLASAQLGCEVDLLTYGQGRDVDIPGVRIIRIPGFRFFGKVKIGPSLFKLFLDIFIFLWTVGLLLKNRYQFVHAHEEAVFICSFLKPIFRFKLVYDMHSSLPQQLGNFKFSRMKLLVRMFKWLEDMSLRAADAVITICPDLADYVLSQNIKSGSHFLIENSIFEPVKLRGQGGAGDSAEQTEVREKAFEFLNRQPTAVYAGTLEAYQGIDLLIDAFAAVQNRLPETGLLIVGGSPEQVRHFKDKAGELGLRERILFLGQVSPDLARALSKSAAVLVSPRSRGTNTPLKIYEQLASGVPLVATNIYSHTQVLTNNVAILVEPSPQGIAEGLVTAFQDRERAAEIAGNAQKLYEEKYSRAVYEQKMKALLEYLR